MYDNLKERLTDMSVLATTRTPADALKYIEELEAKLAKAVEALTFYATASWSDLDDDIGFDPSWHSDTPGKLARTTLAELTGGKDE